MQIHVYLTFIEVLPQQAPAIMCHSTVVIATQQPRP